MKIVIDARMYGTENGGIGRYIMKLVQELQAIDKKNEYVLLLRKKHFDSLNTPERWSKELVDIRHYSFSEQISLAHKLKSLNPDLVHFPHFNVPINYKGDYIVTIHDLLMHKRTGMGATTLPYWLYLVKRAGYKTVFNKAISRAKKIIVPTNFVKNEIAKAYPDTLDRLSVVYEGVDEGVFKQKVSSGYLRRNKIEKPYFLYVGSVYPHKNVERAIEAVVALNSQSDKKIKLVIVTPRNVFQERLNQFTNNQNARDVVHFTGYVEDHDLSVLYSNAAAFVYPSKEEGFGLPGLEAMANECLVVASDIPVFKEVYKDNALYFNPLDFSSIEKAMKEALLLSEVDREKIVKKAKKFAEGYSWRNNAKETLNIYNSLGD